MVATRTVEFVIFFIAILIFLIIIMMTLYGAGIRVDVLGSLPVITAFLTSVLAILGIYKGLPR